ncbi:HD-GYP domain-containing protein [Crassaminicella profunda]|uniref:HD-GYP domain-containing protein n=1 Tax=Crassaminicella profunda TaxID=1286698 RepID=UPI001CA7B65C|nr:HD-GYP domain-containing protein [Crassaminicella profunda]QZY55281.1 HD-GYP domain-containing protein [Crassaminicella profunda]
MAPELKTIKIPLTQLAENMVIATDILDHQGRKLISKGYKVTSSQRIKDLLDKHQLKNVEIHVYKNNPFRKEEELPIPDAKDMSLVNTLEEEIITLKESLPSIKKRISTDFQYILEGKELPTNVLKQHTKANLKILNLRTNVFQLIEIMRKLDNSIYTHCYNVALTSYSIGKWMNLSEDDLEELFLAAMLIDVGKLQVPKEIIYKKGSLSYEEQMEIQKHAIYSYNLVKPYTCISHKIKQTILTHHERIDGKGYPLRLKASDIPLYSRIIAVADVYNTLITEKVGTFTVFDVLKIMKTEYKNLLDLNILYTFLKYIGCCFIGQKVKLDNQEIGEIVFINDKQINKPLIKLLSTNKIIDLNTYRPYWKIKQLIL